MDAPSLLILLTVLSAAFARAELRLAPLFRDHAVLQQGKPVPVWGWTEPGRAVTVTFHESMAKATAGADGRWQVMLPAMKASAEPVGTPENVHPRNKQDVGARLAQIANAQTYHLGGEWSGPAFNSAARERNALRLSFQHVASGLVLKATPTPAFEVAGADGQFHPATARVDGVTLIVQSDAVSAPAAVRYAWANAPQAALFNSEGLTASPFRYPFSVQGATRGEGATAP